MGDQDADYLLDVCCEAALDAVVTGGQLSVMESQQVQHRRVEVVQRGDVLRRFTAG
jgi:hypothetical protein